MPDTIKVQDMPAELISELLKSEPWHLSRNQADALSDFINEIGGIDNAWAAIEMLNKFEENG